MDIHKTSSGSDLVFKITGNWTFQDHEKVATAVIEMTTAQCIIDVTDVDFIDSAGLGMLISAQEKVAERGGRITIRGASGSVRRIMDLAHFDELFTIE